MASQKHGGDGSPQAFRQVLASRQRLPGRTGQLAPLVFCKNQNVISHSSSRTVTSDNKEGPKSDVRSPMSRGFDLGPRTPNPGLCSAYSPSTAGPVTAGGVDSVGPDSSGCDSSGGAAFFAFPGLAARLGRAKSTVKDSSVSHTNSRGIDL